MSAVILHLMILRVMILLSNDILMWTNVDDEIHLIFFFLLKGTERNS